MKNEDIDDYLTFLKFKSISTDPQYKTDVLACADWLTDYLKKCGLEVERWETEGHPTLFATNLKAGPDKPTLLIYHHYDVQPVDPLDEWKSDPFDPLVKDGVVYARGASDNKGQCFYTLCALQEVKDLDFNLKLVIEGEEEIGSPGLQKLCEKKAEQLKADYLLVVDVDMPERNEPGVTLGARGITTMEIKVRGAKADLHSGNHGGMAYNPARALMETLVKCWDTEGKIAIPGFLEGITPIPLEELEQLDLEMDEKAYQDAFGVAVLGGGKTANWLEPTIEINGFSSGYTGEGFKTIIPAVAKCKLSCRLVPGQDPDQIAALVSDFLQAEMIPGMEINVTVHHGGAAVRTSSNSPFVKLCVDALETVFKKKCRFILTGGSIPIAQALSQASGAEVLFLGMALPEDAVHSPNEHFDLNRLELGFLTLVELFKHL
ncbi:MAG: M20/M25/M40 family metallo-hydrolase [Chlamydiales bacterium]|nr:M20/M25/M40 family metallo-hydrolase [Chlamydiales bacterium]